MLCFFSFYKNPAFREEKEYRIIVPKSDNLKIRYRIGGNDKIIPYIEPTLVDKSFSLPIVEIKLGPKNVNSSQMVSAMLTSITEKYKPVIISSSSATYR